jgi:hypothetical protein
MAFQPAGEADDFAAGDQRRAMVQKPVGAARVRIEWLTWHHLLHCRTTCCIVAPPAALSV